MTVLKVANTMMTASAVLTAAHVAHVYVHDQRGKSVISDVC